MKAEKQSGCSYARCRTTLSASMILVLTLATAASASSHEKTLYSFTGSPDANPYGALIADTAGNLYGTTLGNGSGTVFELSPPATSGGSWTRTVLYAFQGGDTDGAFPYTSLIFDNAGNLYGTTYRGGPGNWGTVFELKPPVTSGGPWTESVIFFFPSDSSFGYKPAGRLAFDDEGNLYGMATWGGSYANCNCGTFFELKPPVLSGDPWTPSVIHTFRRTGGEGINPVGDLTFWRGHLFGMTLADGYSGLGTLFEAVPSHGTWRLKVILDMGGEALGPIELFSRLAFDQAGNMYGVSMAGGYGCSEAFYGCGTVFKLSPNTNTSSGWELWTLFGFIGGSDGAYPSGAIAMDKAGNIYGTTSGFGFSNTHTSNNGTVFELTPSAVLRQAGTLTTLHEFGGSYYDDGSQPNFGLIFFKGKLYGTTPKGGTENKGTVFSIVVD